MRSSPISLSVRKGFTLIEILVAIAVLALMWIVFAQMFQTTGNTWLTGQARVNNFIKGRAMLDLVARDLQSGIYRSDLAAFPSISSGPYSFYTERPGYSTGTNSLRSLSWVQYSFDATNVTMLKRGDMPMTWAIGDAPAFGSTNAPTSGTITDRDTASGVVAFKILFLDSGGQLSTNYSSANPPKAFAIGLAVVDDNTLAKLSTSQISQLQSGFASGATGTNSLKADWESYLKTGINWTNYPRSMGSGLKVFERYVILP